MRKKERPVTSASWRKEVDEVQPRKRTKKPREEGGSRRTREGRQRIHRRSPLCENKSDTNRRNALTSPRSPLARSTTVKFVSLPHSLANVTHSSFLSSPSRRAWRTNSAEPGERRRKGKNGSETRVSHARHASRWRIDWAARLRRVTRRNDPIMVSPRFYRPLSFVIIANSRRTAENCVTAWTDVRRDDARSSQAARLPLANHREPRDDTRDKNVRRLENFSTDPPIQLWFWSNPWEILSFLLRRTSTTAGFKYLF